MEKSITLLKNIVDLIKSEYFEDCVTKRRFGDTISLLEEITDPRERIKACYNTIISYVCYKISKKHGDMIITTDREFYKRAKKGLENIHPDAILLEDNDRIVDCELLLNKIPKNHPLVKYFYTLSRKWNT